MAAGCLGESPSADPSVHGETLKLATTTSTYTTGLLPEINDAFEDRFGVAVDTVPQGTGAALATGRHGDADVVMVHARSLEDEFLRDGYGTNRRDLMYNDFVLVGPANDPDDIGDVATITEAFTRLAETKSTFVSRGDNSGTHQREIEIWDVAGIEPNGDWYRSIGSGMGQTLIHAAMAGQAYTLSDRATYLSMEETNDLAIIFEGSEPGLPALLGNPYGIIAVDPARHPNVAYDLAMAYIGFLTSQKGQELIGSFTANGDQLFVPAALVDGPNFDQFTPEASEE